MRLRIQLMGERELREAFKALPKETRKAMKAATLRAAKRIETRARPLVPIRFGYLRDALGSKVTAAGTGIVGIHRRRHVRPGIYTRGRRRGQQRNPILTTLHAHLAHDGTVRSRGVPFLTIAAGAEGPQYLREVKDAWQGVVRASARTSGGGGGLL
jgi:hypothetical protein